MGDLRNGDSGATNCYKLEFTILNRKGEYQQAKIKDEDVWISLQFHEDLEKISRLHNAIDNATLEWEEDARKNDFIEIPKSLFEES